MKKNWLVIFHLLLCTVGYAQSWEVGGWLGTAYIFGDINSNFQLKRPGYGAGLLTRYNFDERVCLKGSLNYGAVASKDSDSPFAYQKARNLSHRTDIAELTLQAELNYLPYKHGDPHHSYTPYLLVGVTGFFFNPQAKLDGKWYNLQPLGTEGQRRGSEYMRFQPALAYGIGMKYDLSYDWSINIEFSGRKLFTDYLDDVSGKYPNYSELRDTRGDIAVRLADRSGELDNSEPIGLSGRQRGDVKVKDTYVLVGVGLVYNFASVKCPAFR